MCVGIFPPKYGIVRGLVLQVSHIIPAVTCSCYTPVSFPFSPRRSVTFFPRFLRDVLCGALRYFRGDGVLDQPTPKWWEYAPIVVPPQPGARGINPGLTCTSADGFLLSGPVITINSKFNGAIGSCGSSKGSCEPIVGGCYIRSSIPISIWKPPSHGFC